MAEAMPALGWLSAGATLFEVLGSLEQGRAARAHAQRVRQAYEFQAWQAERDAGLAIAVSQRGALEERRQGELQASRALAVAAASGAGVSDPTMVRILANTQGEAAYRAAVALYEGEAQARNLRIEAAAGRVSGMDALAEGYRLQQGYALRAGGQALRGIASLYARYGQHGPGTAPAGRGDAALIDAGTPSFTPAA